MPKRVPRPFQTPPKWSPRPSQIHILSHFVTLFSPLQLGIDFLSCFCCFFVDFLKLEPLNLLIFPRENAIFYKIGIFKTNPKNLRKIIPKPSQNPPKIPRKSTPNRNKSIKIDKKDQDDLRTAKNSKKMRKNAKKCPTWPQQAPKRRGIIFLAVSAYPCRLII